MKKSLFLFLIFAKASFFANASLISYSGYTLDTDTSIVTGGGLEWQRWPSTNGLGLTEFNLLSNGYYSGWRLATSDEVIGLLDAFSPVSVSDAVASTGGFSYSSPYADGSDGFDHLTTILGDNFAHINDVSPQDEIFSETGALFSHINDDGEEVYGTVLLHSDYKVLGLPELTGPIASNLPGKPSDVSLNLGLLSQSFLDDLNTITDPSFREHERQSAVNTYSKYSDSFSIALVRDIEQTGIQQVPELSASTAPVALLLLIGLLCLGIESRRKRAIIA